MIDFSRYGWLLTEYATAPKMVQKAIDLGKLNTTEVPGPKANKEVLKLAKVAGIDSIYKSDETAWCAVAMTAIALQSGKDVPFEGYDRLRAKSFLKFGRPVVTPMFGDVLVFTRTGGGHVGLYVGEDDACYHVAGGNQSNEFNITRIAKNRLTEARRPHYNSQPASVRKVLLAPMGMVSKNES